MIKYLENVDKAEFKGYTLLLPVVSVGNVGQLAVDLLLENSSKPPLIKIAQIFHKGLEPVVGADSLHNSSLLTACELYADSSQKLAILQFHSPVTKRGSREFVDFLANWIANENFSKVLILGSTMASFRNDVQLSGPNVTYLLGTEKVLEKSKESKLNSLSLSNLWEKVAGEKDGIPGSGICYEIFSALNNLQINEVIGLLSFASDGDNTPEAVELLKTAHNIFNFNGIGTNVRIPKNWDYLNGGTHSVHIF